MLQHVSRLTESDLRAKRLQARGRAARSRSRCIGRGPDNTPRRVRRNSPRTSRRIVCCRALVLVQVRPRLVGRPVAATAHRDASTVGRAAPTSRKIRYPARTDNRPRDCASGRCMPAQSELRRRVPPIRRQTERRPRRIPQVDRTLCRDRVGRTASSSVARSVGSTAQRKLRAAVTSCQVTRAASMSSWKT